MAIETINPATGKPIRRYELLGGSEIEERLRLADQAAALWRVSSFAERSASLEAAAGILRKRKGEFGRLMTEEMGKPIAQAESEAEKCAWVCEYYAENAESLLRPERRATDARESFVRYDPLGPILAIMPWNFPFWQVFRFAAPAIAAGNTALLKHALNVPGCALAIETLLLEAGLPRGVFQTLLVARSGIPRIIEDPRVRGVTLTGSDRAGSQVAQNAGRAIKKAVLELGGSDPFLVLEDADIERAASVAVQARIINSGQSCIAAKRFIIHESLFSEFRDRFVARLRELRTGDPLDPATDVGPLAREDLLENLDRQVKESVRRGAELLAGGRRLDRPGFFYEPTALAAVERDMPAASEETFGPVAALIAAKDEDEAVAIANDSLYGLGANVWTRDLERGKRVAARLEAGCVFVNDFVKSDPRLPFGGVKRSGYGRELSSEGIREFVNIKTVSVA